MKMKWLTIATSFLLAGTLVLGACTNGDTDDKSGNTTHTQHVDVDPKDGKCDVCGKDMGTGNTDDNKPGSSVTINMYTSVNIIEQNSLQEAAYAYEEIQSDKGNDVTIVINNDTDPDSYGQKLRNMLGGTINEPTIASVAPIPEYHGTDKIVDLSGFLEEETEYSPDYASWMESLEPDAYRSVRAGANVSIPGISYSSNYTCVFYDKAAVKELLAGDPIVSADGTIDASKVTWQWMIDALQKVKGKPGFPNPLGLSRSEQSCGQVNFNFVTSLINMYLDQYFRDFIQTVHSEEGDYSYVPSIDAGWEYDTDNLGLDLSRVYSYNLNKVVDNYFNHSDTYGPESARYKEVMENLHELLSYSDAEASYHDIFSRFNETTIMYEKLGGAGYADLKLFYVETLGYVRTYRDAFADKMGHPGYPDATEITSKLGWFLFPAMQSELPGVADNVRPWGGPLENYGVLSTGSSAKDEFAVDFLKFLTSPDGQTKIGQNYLNENKAPQVMRQLVKGVQLPTEIDYTETANLAGGDSTSSPYVVFGMGNGLSTARIDNTSDYVRDKAAQILSGYFVRDNGTWSATDGQNLLAALKSGFADYAKQYNLIYSDPANVASATNNLKGSPFNATT